MTLVYEIEALTKFYPGAATPANDDINLTIACGQIFGLLGPNGAGKTTLVRQLAGLLRPTSGSIRLFGVDIVKQPHVVAAYVATQPQSAAALLDLTVAEAVRHTGRLRGLSKAAARESTDQTISILGLGDRADRRIRGLSGGERRLVSLAVTLVGDRTVLILDEPTNELAPETRRLVWEHLLALNATGRTIVLVTHDVAEAERVIGRVGLVNHGRLMALGSIGELRQQVDQRVRLELTLAGPASDELGPLLASVEVLHRTGDRIVLLVDRDAVRGMLNALVERVGEAGLTDFRVQGPSLEDVYLRLGGEQRLG